MAKQLVVTVRAEDQATATLRGIGASILNVGKASLSVGGQALGVVKSVLASVFSLKTAVVGLVAALGARRIAASFADAAAQIDRVAKTGERLGFTIEQVSSLRYTAELANVSFESLAQSLQTAGQRLGQFTATGGGRAAEAFRLLGVPLRDAEGRLRSLTDLLPEFAEALNAIPDVNQRAFLASKIFGANGEVLQLLAEGGDRLRAFNEEARRLGVIFSPRQAAIADAFGDSIDRIKAAWLGLRAQLVEKVGPAITDLNNQIASFLASLPAILGRFTATVRDALGGSGEARAKLAAFWDALKALSLAALREAAVGVLLVGTLAARAVIAAIFRDVGDDIDRRFELLKIQVKLGAIASAQMLSEIASLWNPTLRAQLGAFEAATQALEDRMGEIVSRMQPPAKAMADSFQKMFESDILRGSARELAALNSETAEAARGFAAAAEEVTGFWSALAARSVGSGGARTGGGGEGEAIGNDPADFFGGLKAGLEDFRATALDVFSQARTAAVAFLDGGITTVSAAIVDAISKTKSWADAFTEAGRLIVRQLAEIATRMLLMRLVGGALGAVAAPGAIAGGLVTPAGIRHFDGGGVVPGGYSSRDNQLIAVASGEGVLNHRAMAANAALLGYMNHGGRVEPAGGGDRIVVNLSIHVQGGASPASLAAIERAAQDGVLRAIQQRPAYREQFRRGLS